MTDALLTGTIFLLAREDSVAHLEDSVGRAELKKARNIQ